MNLYRQQPNTYHRLPNALGFVVTFSAAVCLPIAAYLQMPAFLAGAALVVLRMLLRSCFTR